MEGEGVGHKEGKAGRGRGDELERSDVGVSGGGGKGGN